MPRRFSKRRLERIWVDAPIYFVMTCTKNRRAVLARKYVAQILVEEWRLAHGRHGWAIGRYVIMPDHVHFFCRPELDAKTLPEFIGGWKSWTGRQINKLLAPGSATPTALWQAEFFDHVLRSSESYGEKWNYVFDNPVRASLVRAADDWPFAGEIETFML
jgi:putative transposase